MAFALIVLAIGSVLAGYIGIPHALGGHNALATWLEPAFVAHGAAEGGAVAAAGGAGEVLETGGAAEAVEGEASAEETTLELTLMLVSSVVALLGIGLAGFIWLKRRQLAVSAARSFPALHRLLLNKYYVDEIYNASIVEPIRIVSTEGLWRGFDVRVIDGAVNGAASIVGGGSYLLRRLQTGSVRAYAGSVFLGVVLILGYYLWR